LRQCKGDILVELGEDQSAEALYLSLVKENPADAIRLHEQLASIYARRRDYGRALEHFERFHALDKAEFADRQTQQVAMTRRLHETQSARREAEMMAAKNQELEGVVVELRALHQRVWDLSRRDGLTGLYNRRYLDERLPHLFAAQSDEAPLSLLMADLDDFKSINDHYRHQTGDRVLQEVAQIFERSAPGASAFAVRYGGEEFALLLPGTSAKRARALAAARCARPLGRDSRMG
jgi:GGDEF domain-containing protein